MISFNSKLENRYINDLRKIRVFSRHIKAAKDFFILLGIALIF